MNRSSCCWWGSLVFGVFLFAGCANQRDEGQFIARVDDAKLTQENIPGAGTEQDFRSAATREFVADWIDSQLLYQEARRRRLATSEEIEHQLEEVRSRLAIAALLDEELYGGKDSVVSDQQIEAKFASERDSLILKEDVSNVSFALFEDRDAANQFRTNVIREKLWDKAVARLKEEPTREMQAQKLITREYFTQQTLFPDELWKLSRTLPREEVSFVIRTDFGFYVLMVHSLKKQGDVPDLAFVKDEMQTRVLIERRKAALDKLLGVLRARHTIEVRMPTPPDEPLDAGH